MRDMNLIRQGEESTRASSRQKCCARNGCCQLCSRTPPNLQSLKWNSPKWRGPTNHTNSTCDLMLKSNLKSCSMDSMLLTPYCLCEAWETSKNETQKTDHSQACVWFGAGHTLELHISCQHHSFLGGAKRRARSRKQCASCECILPVCYWQPLYRTPSLKHLLCVHSWIWTLILGSSVQKVNQ